MSEKEVESKRIKELREEIAELIVRFPAHSIPPSMIQQLDELEELLERAMKENSQGKPDA